MLCEKKLQNPTATRERIEAIATLTEHKNKPLQKKLISSNPV